jgi:4-amino-4-deoxy-L-arabinose transferase-like glycosyltransferase
MPNSIEIRRPPVAELVSPPARLAEAAALGGIVGLALFRAILALYDRTELWTDEAQYWLWGQGPDFGYFSKPPLIGWIIGAFTGLFGDTVWAVRLPAVLFHAATAAVIWVFARRIASGGVAALAALSYFTTPAVALGSAVMTTDTPLLLAAALAMLAQAALADARAEGRAAPGLAVALGLALGIGLLAKHAMLFWFLGAALAASVSPAWRIGRREAVIATAVAAAVIAPHVAWLAGHGFITFWHVKDITAPDTLSLLRPTRFLAEQLLVMGPVLLVAMALAMPRLGLGGAAAGLTALALTPIVIVLVQAVRGEVLANWAALYLVPGSVLAALWLCHHPRLALVSLAIGLAVSLALPLAKVHGTALPGPGGQPLLQRFLGHGEVARWALDTGAGEGAQTIVAQERDLLADLSWFGRDRQIGVRAMPPSGRPAHHWELAAAFDPKRDPGPVVVLTRAAGLTSCPDAAEVGRHRAGPGFAGGQVLTLYRLADPDCLAPREDGQ